jgi:anti-sigma factor RsiW
LTESDNKTPCFLTLERIEGYLDDDLEAPERVEFECHVAACSACREELDLARRMLREIRGLPQKECPDGVVEKVFAAAEPDGRRPAGFSLRGLFGWRAWSLQPVAVTVVILMVLASTILIGRIRNGSNSASPTPSEIARAEAELRWTIALVGDVGRRTGFTVRDDVLGKRVLEPTRRAVNTVFKGGSITPQTINGGSQ